MFRKIPVPRVVTCLITILILGGVSSAAVAQWQDRRPIEHEQFAKAFWKFLEDETPKWTALKEIPPSVPVPECQRKGNIYGNSVAVKTLEDPQYRAIFVIRHFGGNEDDVVGTTALYKAKEGNNKKNVDWYEVYYLADGTIVKTSGDRAIFDRPGFVTRQQGNNLWVCSLDSPDLSTFVKGQMPNKGAQLADAMVGGLTLHAADETTIQEYLAAKEGFATRVVDNRIWVFAEEKLRTTQRNDLELPEKHVTRVGAGPNRMTLKGTDAAVLDSYINDKRGFKTVIDEDGRLWVFRVSSPAWEKYTENGLPEKHVTRIGAGPNRQTVKSDSTETITDYVVSQPGFSAKAVDGEIWVTRIDAPELNEFRHSGRIEKHVKRENVGPLGMTIKAPDEATIDLYLEFFPKRD